MIKHSKTPMFFFSILLLCSTRIAHGGIEHILRGMHTNWKEVSSILAAAGISYATYHTWTNVRRHNHNSYIHTLLCRQCPPTNVNTIEPAINQDQAPSTIENNTKLPQEQYDQEKPEHNNDHHEQIPSLPTNNETTPTLEFNNPLLQAIMIGDSVGVKEIMQTGQQSVDAQEHGITAIELALNIGNQDVINLLLDYQDQSRQVEYGNPGAEDNIRNPIPVKSGTLSDESNIRQQKEYLLARETNLAEVLNYDDAQKAEQRAYALLDENANIHEVNSQGDSALMVAAGKGFIDIVKILLLVNADPYFINPSTGENVLLHLLRNWDIKNRLLRQNQKLILNYLITNFDVKKLVTPTARLGNALTLAVQTEEIELIDIILKIHPKLIFDIDMLGRNALHYAINSDHIAYYLIDKGVNINQEDTHGITPLKQATQKNKFGIIKKLIDRNVLLDDKPYQELLVQAAKTNNIEIAQMLILSRTPKESESARTATRHALNSEITNNMRELLNLSAELYENPDFLWKIAQYKNDQDSPIIQEVQKNNASYIESVMGQDVNCRNIWGLTPLMIASILGHTKCMKALIRKNAQINDEIHGKTTEALLLGLIERNRIQSAHSANQAYEILENAEGIRNQAQREEQAKRKIKLAEAAENRKNSKPKYN